MILRLLPEIRARMFSTVSPLLQSVAVTAISMSFLRFHSFDSISYYISNNNYYILLLSSS